MSVTNETAVGLPPLSMTRKETWDYYRIEFLDDGYPGRRSKFGLHAHPLYGTYVIKDYVFQYRKTKNEQFLVAARRVADAAINRMTGKAGALVFYYHPNRGLSSLPNIFYSGLTQARYLSAFGALDAQLSSRRYAEASSAILKSLRLPANAGGVARNTPGGGLLIEEYSHDVPDYTLNGWTTATTLIKEYALTAGADDAVSLFDDSVRGLRDVLPLFDLPELANSRYRLAGPARIRLELSMAGATIGSAAVIVPGEGKYGLGAEGGKWTNRFVGGMGSSGEILSQEAIMEVLLCRSTWPAPNRLISHISAPEDGTLKVQIGEGSFDPLISWLRPDSFTTIGEFPLRAGANTIDVAIPWIKAELVAYPTTWTKLIGGRHHNSYHFIHIDTLDTLVKATGDEMLTYYRDKWAEYPSRWPDIAEYVNRDIVLERYKAKP